MTNALDIQPFYRQAQQWFECNNLYNQTKDLKYLRERTKIFDWMEFRIFQATLLKDIPLNDDEMAFLSIPRENRCGILWQEEGDL